MGLFNFGKKENATSCCASEVQETPKTACSCGGACAEESQTPKKARFIVLGACCKKSAETFENAKQAVKELGIESEVTNIGDAVEIAKYGVMQTPALVLDGKVVSYGKYLSTADVKKLLEQAGVK